MKHFLGIDVGGSYIKSGIVSERGEVSEVGKTKTYRKEPETVLATVRQIISQKSQSTDLDGIGVSIPGVIDKNFNMVTSGAIEGLAGRNILNELQEGISIPLTVVNDANAIALAERWVGAAQGCHDFVCLPLGTGVGGAIVINDRLITGKRGASGEFGMMLLGTGNTIPVGYESASYQCGAVAGLCRLYNKGKGRKEFSEWELDVRQIISAAEAGEEIAKESLATFYQNVSVLLVNVAASLDPDMILIGGGISENRTIFKGIEEALKCLLNNYQDFSAIGFPIVKQYQLGNSAGLIGAVYPLLREED